MRETRNLARAIRERTQADASRLGRGVRLGQVTSTKPLSVAVTHSSLVLGDDDLILGQSVRAYEVQKGLKVGDNLVLAPLQTGDWIVVDALSEGSPFEDAPDVDPEDVDPEDVDEEGVGEDVVKVVIHGEDATKARPEKTLCVVWIGSVYPENSISTDPWFDTSGSGPPEVTDYGLVSIAELEAIEAVKGDRAQVIAGGGLTWDLIADGDPETSGHPWAVIGGAPLRSEEMSESPTTASTSYVTLSNNPAVTIPLEGIYDVKVESDNWNSSGAAYNYMSYKIGATAASDNDSWFVISVGANYPLHASRERRKTGLATAAVLQTQCRVNAGTSTWNRRLITAKPVRIG